MLLKLLFTSTTYFYLNYYLLLLELLLILLLVVQRMLLRMLLTETLGSEMFECWHKYLLHYSQIIPMAMFLFLYLDCGGQQMGKKTGTMPPVSPHGTYQRTSFVSIPSRFLYLWAILCVYSMSPLFFPLFFCLSFFPSTISTKRNGWMYVAVRVFINGD